MQVWLVTQQFYWLKLLYQQVMEKRKSILIIEDHEIVVWALRVQIEDRFPGAVVLSALDFYQGLAKLRENQIDLVILDINVPGGNSPEMISQLRKIKPAVRILIHSGMEESEYALIYLAAGADGYLSKTAPLTSLWEAAILTMQGKKYVSERAKQAIADNFLNDPAGKWGINFNTSFTNRELEVMKLLLEGKWTKEIAEELGIKLNTVSTHKQSIFEKVGVSNIIDLYKKVEKQLPHLLR